jgi:hypothetical protein
MSSQTTQRLVRVTFSKTCPGAPYSSERAEVTLEWYVSDEDDSHTDLEAAEEMLRHCRDLVNIELRRSPDARIRQVAGGQPPRPEPPLPRESAYLQRLKERVQGPPVEPDDDGDEAPF